MIAEDGEHDAAVQQRRCHVHEREVAALGREGHFQILFEAVVPGRLGPLADAGVAVVVQPRPVEDVSGPDRFHQAGRLLGAHTPQKL